MGLRDSGFEKEIQAAAVTIHINDNHFLLKLAKKLPWEDLLSWIMPDLKQTTKGFWWKGRPLYVRIHLGIYLLQQIYNRTDREMERSLYDNAAYQVFCGYGIVDEWHVPDHTKIEEFRSRLHPETQRKLANAIAVLASKFGYANPANIDIDSTAQEANIAYPSRGVLLVKVAAIANKLVKPLNYFCGTAYKPPYFVDMRKIKAKAKIYFLSRKSTLKYKKERLRLLWREVFEQVLPVMKDSYQLIKHVINKPNYWNILRAIEQLQWKGFNYLTYLHKTLFEDKTKKLKGEYLEITPTNAIRKYYAFHLDEISCFNKGKINKGLEFGRAYQLTRIEGNFLIVGECNSVRMPDSGSLPQLIYEHQELFGKQALKSIATDKGYFSQNNEMMLKEAGIEEIGLQRPDRVLNCPRSTLSLEPKEKLYNRRAGIEAMISHAKHGGQLGRSRMKSDSTILASGYSSILGLNLRKLMRCLMSKPPPHNIITQNNKCEELIAAI